MGKKRKKSSSSNEMEVKKLKTESLKGAIVLSTTSKRVLEPCSKRKSKLKKQRIHNEKSKEIKEMTNSIKELSEAIKKLQEILLTKADLLEVSLKEKETPKKKEEPIYTCGFECEEAEGDNFETIFVKGFEYLRPRDEIKNALSEIFSSFGVVIRVFVPIECKTGVPLGFAFINLKNGEGNEKALKLNGRYMEGRQLEVTMARDRDEYYGFDDFNGCESCALSSFYKSGGLKDEIFWS